MQTIFFASMIFKSEHVTSDENTFQGEPRAGATGGWRTESFVHFDPDPHSIYCIFAARMSSATGGYDSVLSVHGRWVPS